MKLNLTEKDISVLKVVSQIAGGFTVLVALTMIFSLGQLKIINPLDNPVVLSVKEQYDRDPANAANAEQVRAIDLMARKAYFSSRWQIETGSYLLIAGAVIFILCQRLIAGNEKIMPVFSGTKPDDSVRRRKIRKSLAAAGSVIFLSAVGASFILRGSLPDPGGAKRNPVKGESQPVMKYLSLIRPTFRFSGDRTAVVLQEGQVTRLNGTEKKERT